MATARHYRHRLAGVQWDLVLGIWDGVGALSVGQHTGLAVGEWHLHAWDLAQVGAQEHRPCDPEVIAAGRQALPKPLPAGDPWTATLRWAGRRAQVGSRSQGAPGHDRGVITRLERVVSEEPGKPVRAGAAQSQARAVETALAPASWTGERSQEMRARFDELASEWDAERGHYRGAPAADALARGGPWPAGLCVEVGSGTGLVSALLAQVWDRVACVDLSPEMLRRARVGARVRADGARLPVRDGVAAAVAIADAPLFAPEVVRVLRPDGVVVWSNALGQGAPFHVATVTLVAALTSASADRWDAVESEAGWGSWAVLRRAHGS